VATILPTLSSIGDPDGTRTVTSIIVLLVALGVALILLAVWIYRSTRPDPELLAPLEVMGERSWRRGDPVWQRRRLDELRPAGAKPLLPSAAPPELDEAFEAGPTASGFDDLRLTVLPLPPDSVDTSGDAASRHGADDELVSVADLDEPAPAPTPEPPPDSTPTAAIGPELDELADDDFDPDALAAAQAELDRELAESHQQLDLFDGERRS